MGYIGAPYNFVPFSKEVQPYPKADLPGHNSVHFEEGEKKELISGEITYRITAKTPVFIGSGLHPDGEGTPEEQYKDGYGRYAIPGSTMRGLIRNNVQILSLSEMAGDIDDYALMFRNVASGPKKEKELYGTILGAHPVPIGGGKKGTISVLDKVKAGYISCESGEYRIYDVEGKLPEVNGQKMNYYVLSEKTVVHEYLQAQKDRRKCRFGLFFKNGNILQHSNWQEFTKENRDGKVHYVNSRNTAYEPYFKACSYEASGRQITAVGSPGEYGKEGYAVSSGPMREKKSIYIIPRMAEKSEGYPIDIPKKDIDSFKIDFKKRKNALKGVLNGKNVEYFNLPEDGNTKPVFYIQDGGKLYFGFTPRLRLFYAHTIYDGIPEIHKKQELDFARALFGFSSDSKDSSKEGGGQGSYKSRLSFSDALMISGAVKGTEKVILAEPKPTSYLDYVKPKENNQGVSYNEDQFELRGIKQYWLRDRAAAQVAQDKEDKEYVSRFNPMETGTEFEGKVRFHNLKPEELGLVLWSLTLNGRAQMNIGKAKAFGFGNIELQVTAAKRLDLVKAYDLEGLCLAPWQDIDIKDTISIYKNQLKDFLDGKRPEDNESIKVLIQMKDPMVKPDPEKIRYMDINNKEFQNRTTPLQRPQDLVGQYKEEAREGGVYTASITKIEGKKISFRIIDLEGNYGSMKVENIDKEAVGRTVTKNELKTVLPIGSEIKIRKGEGEDGKDIWVCVGLPS